MQKNGDKERDSEVFRYLAEREDLAEKKAKIYSRLLTEVSLAKEMETLAVRHANRKADLLAFIGEKGDQK
jgi:hypothetical protein